MTQPCVLLKQNYTFPSAVNLPKIFRRFAEHQGDAPQAIAIWRALTLKAAEGLTRRNLVLRVGRLLNTHTPQDAPEWWREATTRYPTGTHAEEFAFRLGESLARMGRTQAARTAGKAFRTRFPDSDRVAETRGW